MTNSIDESTTTARTFRFASGQILTLDEDQIEKIPYLIALVSSADHFESARDEDGYYKLDRYIQYKYFSFVLESLSFHSVRQLFIRLPKKHDVIPIIALLDFLGLGPQPDPTLKEVDSIFFSTLVYSPLLEKHVQIVRPTVIQDMAVRLAIAMVKEEYDFTKHKVIDQIHWFIMFILSAYEFFGPRLRHHVYKIAEHCFSLFKPSLLKPLKKLVSKTEEHTRQLILIKNKDDFGPDQENKRPLEQLFHPSYYIYSSYETSDYFRPTLKQRQDLLLYRTYIKNDWFWYPRALSEKDLLEPTYRRVLEIMYERLQNDICQQAIAEIRGKNSVHESAQERMYLILGFKLFYRDALPKRIDDIFKSKLVQEEIRERILEELCVLTPKLEQRRVELVKKIREYEQYSETSNENQFYTFHYISLGSSYETMQEEALCHELLLDKLQHGSSIVEQIHQRVLDALYGVALEQFKQWENTQRDIDELYQQLTVYQPLDKCLYIASKMTHQKHPIAVNKPLPKHQLKYSKR